MSEETQEDNPLMRHMLDHCIEHNPHPAEVIQVCINMLGNILDDMPLDGPLLMQTDLFKYTLVQEQIKVQLTKH